MKKRLLSIIIAVCMIFTMLPAAALADKTASGNCGANGDNVKWTLKNGVLTISGKGEMAEYDEQFSPPWSDKRDSIKKCVVEKGVTSICERALFLCENVNSVTLPEGVTYLGWQSFYACKSLKSIVIPSTVKEIGEDSFSRCEGLKNVVIPEGVEIIDSAAFYECTSLKSVFIPSTVTEIGEAVFAKCDKLSDVYYNGSPAQFGKICGGTDFVGIKNATIHYYASPAPELKITTVSGHPKIYWNAVDGAVKYYIYRSTAGKTFKYYDSTTKTSYTNNSTEIGTTYYYKVKAVKIVDGKEYTSDYSLAKNILCKPAIPTLIINRVNGKAQLKWSTVGDAAKYNVYRSTDGKNFKYWDSTTRTSYTNSAAASGTKYYYRVKAVAVVNGKNVESASSNVKSLMTSLATPSVSITTSNGKPKLTWKVVTGADKYYVYRSTDGKNFSYWDSTSKTTFVNSGAKKNTKYYYKVKAVCASNSNANSAQSSAVSIKATK